MGKRKRRHSRTPHSEDPTSALAAAKAAALQALDSDMGAPLASSPPLSSPNRVNGSGGTQTKAKKIRFSEEGETVGTVASGSRAHIGSDAATKTVNGVHADRSSSIQGSPAASGSGATNGIMIGPQLPNGHILNKGKGKATASTDEQDGDEADGLELSSQTQVPKSAFADALKAAVQEYKHHHPNGTAPPTNLPHTASQKLEASILYFGTLPPSSLTSTHRRKTVPSSKRPRWQPPPLPASASASEKPAKSREEKRREASEGSELDEDEFADVFGYELPSAAASVDAKAEGEAEEEEYDDDEDGYDYDDEEDVEAEERPVGSSLGQDKDGSRRVEDSLLNGVAGPSVPSTAAMEARANEVVDMEVGGTTSRSPSPPIASSLHLATHNNQPNNEDHHSLASSLTPSQQHLLSNALSAQYWAGYHTALFHRAVGDGPREEDVRPVRVDDEGEMWRKGREAAAAATATGQKG